MAFNTLLVAKEGNFAVVTLNRPEVLHALNAVLFDDLEAAFRELEADPEVRAILLTGSGDRAFAAGADIRGLAETDAVSGRAVSVRGQKVFRQIERCTKPVVACVNGVALGGGCELALACHVRLASERARMGLPELKLGLIPGYGGTQRLPRLIGRGPALAMMLTARVVDAAEALRLGLVDEVVPADRLMERGRELAGQIAGLAPLAARALLEAVDRGLDGTLDEGLQREADLFGELCGTADKAEGLAAFLEKRTASWRGE